jgi:hypothetical protein
MTGTKLTYVSNCVIAVDPGNAKSAWLVFDGVRVLAHAISPNDTVVNLLSKAPLEWPRHTYLAIETMKPRGMPTAFEEMQTQLWAGRFIQAYSSTASRVTQVFRSDVKMHICGRATAKDTNIRQALIDRFGGKAVAMGNKKSPGPLYGLHDDLWSALAIAITWWETPLVLATPPIPVLNGIANGPLVG